LAEGQNASERRCGVKIYISLCGLVFAFATFAHSVELMHGGLWHLREADWLISTVALVGMLGWSIILLLRR
jgi:hypothetical protein